MFGPDQNNLMNNCKILNLRSRFEACPNISAVTVQLRSVSSPYNIIETTNTQGGGNISLNVMLSNPVNGVPYYVVIKSVNSIETWSSVPVTFNAGTASYNFTSSINQAFGNNQILSGGIPSIYQGDANQDGFVNSVDVILVYNDAISFITTPATDFNCDGVTDVSDLILGSNNSSAFIQKITP